MTKYILHIITFSFLLLVIESCKKDDYSMLDDIQNAADYSSSQVGKANAIVIQGVSYGDTTTAIPSVPIFLNRAESHNVTIKAEIDTSLIASYNQMYSTQYNLISSAAFKLGNNSIEIPAGQTQSTDSFRIYLQSAALLNVGVAPYLIPLRLTSSDGSLQKSIAFVKMNVTVSQIFGNINGGGSWYDGGVYGSTTTLDNKYLYTYILTKNFDQPIIAPDSLAFTAGLTSSLQMHSLVVNAELTNDASIIQAYNDVNGSHVLPFPDGTFDFYKDSAVVPANYTSLYNGLALRFKNYDLFNSNDTFLLAMRPISKKSPYNVEPDTASRFKYSYIKLKINHVRNGNVDASNGSIVGTVSDRSTWKITSSYGPDSLYYSNPPSNVLDGNNTTYWNSPGWSLPQDLIVDAGSVQTFKGFRITPQYADLTRDFLQISIATSEDKIHWISQGYYFGTPVSSTSSADQPDIKNIKFITPVNARYINFSIQKSTSSYYTGVAEINGIQ